MFKKVYIEITNICNLSCSFCVMNKRDKQFMNISDFKMILNKLHGYTKYLYFHVMGEPLMHPEINKLIDYASNDYYINVTTNGFLIERIKDNKNIRQINISLHSYDDKYSISLEDYLDNIFTTCDELSKSNTYINYRLWVDSKYKKDIINKLEEKYNIKINSEHIKIRDNIFLDFDRSFIWPSLNNNIVSKTGSCLGTREHIGILVDGTVIPCCLDSEGIINLGNIYKQELNDIITSEKFLKLRNSFLQNKKICELCQKCNFYDSRC